MRINGKASCCAIAGLLFASSVLAQIEVIPQSQPESVFAGAPRQLCITIRNPGQDPVQGELHYALNQKATAVAAPIARAAWKKIHVLPTQTVIECEKMSFPSIRSPTPFLIQWTVDKHVVGRTDVLVYPPDLLHELKTLISSQVVGAFDPRNVIKPLLVQHKIDYEDLERMELEQFTGSIVIAGPFTDADQMPPRLAARLRKLAARSIPAVWIQPPQRAATPAPSWCCVREGGRLIVIAQDNTVANLAESPTAQLAFIELVKTALHGKDPHLPDDKD